MRRLIAMACAWLLPVLAWSAVQNGQFTVTWTVPADIAPVYEFRWRHAAHDAWHALPSHPSSAGTFTASFAPLAPSRTDRWLCVDARAVLGDIAGPWLSDTTDGAACNVIDAAVIVLPPPPVVPPPPTPPQPPPPTDTFSNLSNSNGVLSFDYLVAECKRGVQQTTGAIKHGVRTITLICRR